MMHETTCSRTDLPVNGKIGFDLSAFESGVLLFAQSSVECPHCGEILESDEDDWNPQALADLAELRWAD